MSAWLPHLTLDQPLWLALLLLLPLARRAPRLRRDHEERRLQALADPHLLRRLLVAPPRRPHLLILVPALIALAAAGPRLQLNGNEAQSDTGRGADIAVVVDISPSMNADDIGPSRLARAQLELRDFSARLAADRTALIVYSAYAYTLLPLTRDPDLLRQYTAAVESDLTRRQGSNLAQGLERAAQVLQGAATGARAIVLLSDGGAQDRDGVLAAADRLARHRIPVFALGIGTAVGAPVPGDRGYVRQDGATVISRLDRSLLEVVAERSGGRYADVSPDDRDWDRLFAGLDPLREPRALPGQDRGRPLFPWLLAAALGLLLWHGAARLLPRAVPLALGAALALPPMPADAGPWREAAAWRALQSGDYDAAERLYDGLDSFAAWMGRGAVAYRRQDWRQAAADFGSAERIAGTDDARASAAYNRANALARSGRLQAAADGYRQALRWNPNHPRAALNLSLVERAAVLGAAQPRQSREGTPLGGDTARPDAAAASGAGRGDAAAALAPALQRWQLGQASDEATAAALRQLGSLQDEVRAVLRHRVMAQDTEHPLRTGREQPW